MNDTAVLPEPFRVDMSASYDQYYQSGLYDRRYPAPNREMMRLLARRIGGRSVRVLDFGCGNGRYALPLITQFGATVIGYDISAEALRALRQRGAAHLETGQLTPMGGSFEDLMAAMRQTAPVDIVLMAFGVLAHILGRRRRVAELRDLATLLPKDGCLIATVPNGTRRFRREQRDAEPLVRLGVLEPGDIRYERQTKQAPIVLTYHMYSADELSSELAEAGLRPLTIEAESVLPERMVTTYSAAAAFDAMLRRMTPLGLAYGFAAVAAPTP